MATRFQLHILPTAAPICVQTTSFCEPPLIPPLLQIGIGPRYPTKFLLLKNGNTIPIAYLANGSPNLRPDDIILRAAVDPATSAVPASASTESVADRLTE